MINVRGKLKILWEFNLPFYSITVSLGALELSLLYDSTNNALHCTVVRARVSIMCVLQKNHLLFIQIILLYVSIYRILQQSVIDFYLLILRHFSWLVGFMMFNATFNNILVISWRSVLLVEETWVPGENHWPVASHWQTLSHNVVSSGDRHWLHTAIGSYKSNYHMITTMTPPYRHFRS